MRRTLFILTAMTFGCFAISQAQELRAGLSAGIPLNNAEIGYSFNYEANANFLWGKYSLFKYGFAGSYMNFVRGGEFESSAANDLSYATVAGSARLEYGKFRFGGDFGYYFRVSEYPRTDTTLENFESVTTRREVDNNGGFYFKSALDYSVSRTIQLSAYYGLFSDNGQYAFLNLGVNFLVF